MLIRPKKKRATPPDFVTQTVNSTPTERPRLETPAFVPPPDHFPFIISRFSFFIRCIDGGFVVMVNSVASLVTEPGAVEAVSRLG
jgi:hypothetical protein